jgi:hypothetical protein
MDGKRINRVARGCSVRLFFTFGCLLALSFRGDSLRRQTQLSEQYIAEHGLDLDEDDIGVSASDGSNIAHYLPCVGGWTADAVVALSVAIACGYVLPPSAQIAQISFSSPARSIAPD